MHAFPADKLDQCALLTTTDRFPAAAGAPLPLHFRWPSAHDRGSGRHDPASLRLRKKGREKSIGLWTRVNDHPSFCQGAQQAGRLITAKERGVESGTALIDTVHELSLGILFIFQQFH